MSSLITPDGGASFFDRRDFLRLMGASLALLPLEACRDKMAPESLIPYVQAPESRLLGEPESFATALPYYGLTQGLLVTSHEGRPTKIEGHPKHPMSGGATSIFAQASVLDLYDPYRLRKSRLAGREVESSEFKKWLLEMMAEQKKSRGASFCLITEPLTSPSLIAAIENLKRNLPEMLWVSWSPLHHDGVFAGTARVFGEPLSPFYDLTAASHILALDHDFLGSEHDAVAHARAWADRRRSEKTQVLRVLETTLSLTGAKADQRLAVSPAKIGEVIAALEKNEGAEAKFLASGGQPLIVLGSHHRPEWHARVARLNAAFKSSAIRYRKPLHRSHVGQTAQLEEFLHRASAGHITTCVVLGGNPAFSAPADMDVASALRQIGQTVHVSESDNETSHACKNVAARAHYLETWGDVESSDGTYSLVQPLIRPLFDSIDDHQLFETLDRHDPLRSSQEILTDYWGARGVSADAFRSALASGIVGHSQPFVSKTARRDPNQNEPTIDADEQDLFLRLAPDPTLRDGRFSDNAWLQELPKPITSLTWDNAALLSPALARTIGVANGEHVEITTPAGHCSAPAFIVDGLPDKVVTLHLGSGRSVASPVGLGSGVDAYRLRSGDQQWIQNIQSLKKVPGTTSLARPQTEMPTAREDLYTETPLPSARAGIGHGQPPDTSTAAHSQEYQWAMSIDLDTCTGCMSCVIACQAENNIPVVGKNQVLNGRIMHWIRIDRYNHSGLPRPQPVTCMHCEKAPCEVVCPVEATVHSSEGLNQMVYNRCVGTRYCSNNCPYKVRRFNFYKYTDDSSDMLKMQRNPDVTVRSRGVMEKCSYCVQRITRAQIASEKLNRPVADGEVRTACQAACPPRAIVFGNLLDPQSEVARLRKNSRTYGLLTELGTRPRTTYLAPKPSIKGGT